MSHKGSLFKYFEETEFSIVEIQSGFQREIVDWFEENGREFPWRKTGLTPYKVFLTEFLLQRTRAETVESIWIDFFEKYPGLPDLKKVKRDELSEDLKGLGFHNRRARDIKKSVSLILEEKGGRIPKTEEELLELPGVGLYIANSTLCFGFDKKRPIVDTNMKRVYEYLFDLEVEDDLRNDEKVWEVAEKCVPDENFKEFNWGLLDLGFEMKEDIPELLVRLKKGS